MAQNLTTLQETLRSPLDGTEQVRLATNGANWKAPLSSIIGQTQRLISATPYTLVASDAILVVNVAGPVTINLLASAGRGGMMVVVKDISGAAATNNITIVPNGAEKIDGASSYVISTNRASVGLNPFNDGTHTGWFIT